MILKGRLMPAPACELDRREVGPHGGELAAVEVVDESDVVDAAVARAGYGLQVARQILKEGEDTRVAQSLRYTIRSETIAGYPHHSAGLSREPDISRTVLQLRPELEIGQAVGRRVVMKAGLLQGGGRGEDAQSVAGRDPDFTVRGLKHGQSPVVNQSIFSGIDAPGYLPVRFGVFN